MLRLVAALLLIANCALVQDNPPGPQKSWRDPAEFDLARAATASTSPAQQLAALDKWRVLYPTTDYSDERLDMYLNTYVSAKQPRQAFDTAQEILKTRPDNLAALMQTVAQIEDIGAMAATSDYEVAERSATRIIRGPLDRPRGWTDSQWAAVAVYASQVLAFVEQAKHRDSPLQVQLAGSPVPKPDAQYAKLDVQYTDEARLAGLEGSADITGTIDGDGLPHDLRVTPPLDLGLEDQAIAAAAQLRFAPGQARPVEFAVAFTLPDKHSRWHLVAVKFKAPQGASRPTFAAADYPVGPGIGLPAYEEAEILSVIGRAASATVSFDIDQQGSPGNFLVEDASAEAWGPEAVRMVQRWRFHPGMKAGAPVSVPCRLSLIWGPEDFTAGAISDQLAQLLAPPSTTGMTATRAVKPLPGPPVIFKKEPEYTDDARRAGVEGTVRISGIVNEQGALGRMSMDGPSLDLGLIQNSLDAIKQWRFEPTILNGQAIAVPVDVQVDFKLAGVESFVFLRPPMAATKVPQRK